MKKLMIFLVAIATVATAFAQEEKKEKKFDFKFYGRVRGDLTYNSRASQESVDGLFYVYPLDKKLDPTGMDYNAFASGNFYMLYTRLGVDIKGPQVGKATTQAKVEMDFRGSGTTYALPRVRQAYVELGWEKHKLLIGQTWHPMMNDLLPTMLNLSTGAPYHPFSRTPMVRYRGTAKCGLQFTAAALWQSQYNSPGPEDSKLGAKSAKSFKYLKNGCMPEVFLGIDYKQGGWLAGIGGNLLTLRPRRTSIVATSTDSELTYKVDEHIASLSAEAHVKYAATNWNISAKTTLGQNLAHASMLGGYAVSSRAAITGEQQYTPYRHSSTWVSFVWGKKWQPAVFLGYTKNLGTTKDMLDIANPGDKPRYVTYATGSDIDQLASAVVSLTYNLPHWKIGAEFEPTTAWYGTPDKRGRVSNTHAITNYRVVATAMFVF